MKKIRILIISAAFLSFSVSAVADAKSQFKRMDVDKNGVVDADEDRVIREMHFKGLDENQDGSLSYEEFSK